MEAGPLKHASGGGMEWRPEGRSSAGAGRTDAPAPPEKAAAGQRY